MFEHKCNKILSSGKYCRRRQRAFGMCALHIPKNMEIECCICYGKSDLKNILCCNHCICMECVTKLRDTKCPVCRTPLCGKFVTSKIIKAINQRKEEDRIEREQSISHSLEMYTGWLAIGIFRDLDVGDYEIQLMELIESSILQEL